MSLPEAPGRRSLLDRFSVFVIAFSAMLWASDAYFRSALVQHGLNPAEIVLVENALVSLFFVPLLRLISREVRRMRWQSWLAMAVIAVGPQVFATVLFTASFTESAKVHASAETYLLQQIQPLIAITLAWLLLGERRRPYFWPLTATALAAVYLVVFAENPGEPLSSLQHGRLVAGAFALGAATLWAGGTVLGRYALQDLSFLTTTALRFFLALPALLVLMILSSGTGGFGRYAPADILPFLAIAFVPGFFAMLLYYRGLSRTPASLATLAEIAYPVTATLIASLPAPIGFNQPLFPAQIIGSLVLVGVMTALNFLKDRELVTANHRGCAISTPPPAPAG